MIYLKLFLVFLKIGAVAFGGGYGMISLVREEVLSNGWLTEEEFLNFIAVSESTPGPIAVNMATFVGSSQAGFWGAVLCTLGVIIPAFIIILVLSLALKNLLKYPSVQATLEGIKPVVSGLIIATALTMICSLFFSYGKIGDSFAFDWRSVVVFGIVAVVGFLSKKLVKKKASPVFLIFVSALLGMLLFGVLG